MFQSGLFIVAVSAETYGALQTIKSQKTRVPFLALLAILVVLS